MAGSYTLPQVRVFQEFSQTPNDVTQNLNPFVIGPSYQLIRYSNEDERANCSHAPYTGAALNISWATGYSGSEVDKNEFYKVTLDNVYAKLGAAINGKCLNRDSTSGEGTEIEFTLASTKSFIEVGDLELYFDVAVKAGDYLQYESGGVKHLTKILSVSGGKMRTTGTAEISAAIFDKSGASVAATDLAVDLSDYTAGKGGTVTLTVTKDTSVTTTQAKATCSSSAGLGITKTTPVALTANTAVDLGKGLKVTAKTAIAAGDYTIKITVHEPYQRDTVTVADPVAFAAANTEIAFTFIRHVDSAVLADTLVTKNGTTGVTVLASATVKVGSADLTVDSAEAYLTQRNLLTNQSSGIYSVSSDRDITEQGLGTIDPGNPLAFALHIMLMNCATATIKYIAVGSNGLQGYVDALDIASNTSDVYAFCPLTTDREIVDTVVGHVESLSTAEEKSWRIAFFSMPTAETVDLTPKTVSTEPDVPDVPEKCTVDANKHLVCRPAGGTTSTSSSICDFNDSAKARAGDVVEVVNVNGDKTVTTIKKVIGRTELELTDSVSNATSQLCTFTITRTLNKAEYVDALAATSSGFKNHRAYNVFPNTLTYSDGTSVSGIYGAAAVCALACSVAPQQPITNVEINGFTDLPEVYSTYSRDQLNTIAAGGTLILMQEKRGGTVFVRHQISTAYPDGNLNTTELSLVKNLDSISYYFANRLAPYIGRYNLTDDLLTEIKGVLLDGLAHLETATETNRLIGPQVIADGTEIRSLSRDPDEKDKAYADVALNLPAPFNNFDLRLQVI